LARFKNMREGTVTSMVKVAGVTAVLFGAGAGLMALLTGWLGGLSEAAALAFVGLGLYGTSHALSAPGKVLDPREA
jgi:hypothetical protein